MSQDNEEQQKENKLSLLDKLRLQLFMATRPEAIVIFVIVIVLLFALHS